MSNEQAMQILISMRNMMCDQNGCPISDAVFALDKAIEALSADRPQGEWKGYNADKEDWLRTDGTPIFLVCDKCFETVINNGSAHWNYCPNCGCRMKGADDE